MGCGFCQSCEPADTDRWVWQDQTPLSPEAGVKAQPVATWYVQDTQEQQARRVLSQLGARVALDPLWPLVEQKCCGWNTGP